MTGKTRNVTMITEVQESRVECFSQEMNTREPLKVLREDTGNTDTFIDPDLSQVGGAASNYISA